MRTIRIAPSIYYVMTMVLAIMFSADDLANAGHSYPNYITAVGLDNSRGYGDCGRLRVTWEKQPDYNGQPRNYTVRRWKNGVRYGIVYTGTDNSFDDSNLKPNINYQYDVASYTTHWSEYSPRSAGKLTNCSGFHWSDQHTSENTGVWSGVLSSLTTAIPSIPAGQCAGHSNAAIALASPNDTSVQTQVGWWSGEFEGGCAAGNSYKYYEWENAISPSPRYSIVMYGSPESAGTSHYFMIYQYSQPSANDYLFCFYIDTQCVEYVHMSRGSGRAFAFGEVSNYDSRGNDMGRSWFGNSQKAFIKKGLLWEAWDTFLSTGGTQTWDERPNYYISHTTKYDNFKVCGPNNC